MATTIRERTISTGAPVSDLTGVGPGFSRPKHKRTITGYGPKEIKSVEAAIPQQQRAAYVLTASPSLNRLRVYDANGFA